MEKVLDGEGPSFPYTETSKQTNKQTHKLLLTWKSPTIVEIEQPLRQNFSDSVLKKQCKL